MRAFISIAALAAILSSAAAPTSNNVPITKVPGPVKANSYIIKLKDNVSKDSHLNKLASSFTGGSRVQYEYTNVFHGYAATLKSKDLEFVRQSKDIEYIEEDGIAAVEYFLGEAKAASVRSAAESLKVRATCGENVDVYVIDTGIYLGHTCFGGRASWGATFGGYANADGNGHGTHLAATAICPAYGGSSQAHAIAVKVLSDSGSGAVSDVISGINWAYNAFKASGRPSIALMALGGSANTALDSAVNSAIAGGLHFVVPAGGSNGDASSTSPARVAAAVTVGAVDSSNRKASFSSYGSVIDVFAPGVNILSAWIGSTTATNTLSGTSMAVPFVVAILSCAIDKYGQVTPAELSSALRTHARAVVTGAPSGTTNLLATVW
ncbi:serine protease [Ceratobasidium sp. AG-I]|nr:serine protease [Ceratobasidium sp. AG-I]